jgi:hypothetical protein
VLGRTFEYRQTQVLELYRAPRRGGTVLSHRCLRCTTEAAMAGRAAGARAGASGAACEPAACEECAAEHLALVEAQEAALRAQAARAAKEEELLLRARAKAKRDGYAGMFKPAVLLTPLKSRQRGGEPKDDDEHWGQHDSGSESSDGEEAERKYHEELYQPPPRQLDALLPVAIKTKSDFVKTVQEYRSNYVKLEKLRLAAELERRAREAAERAATAKAARRARYEELIGLSLGRLRQHRAARALAAWRANARMLRRLRLLSRKCGSVLLREAWRGWTACVAQGRRERAACATLVQAAARGWLARRIAARERRRRDAAVTLQGFARSILARHVVKAAKRHRKKQQQLVKKSLGRLQGNLKARCFAEWRERAALARAARLLGVRNQRSGLRELFRQWKSNAAALRRQRRDAAVVTLNRVARGFLGRLAARRARRRHAAAVVIQLAIRQRLARDALRLRLRQRRVVKKKMTRALGEDKRARFATWRLYVKLVKALRIMIEGSSLRTKRYFFGRWAERRAGALGLQRLFRGYRGRLLASAAKQALREELARNGCATISEKERFEALLDTSFSSPLLDRLRDEMMGVRRQMLIQKRRAELAAARDKELEARRKVLHEAEALQREADVVAAQLSARDGAAAGKKLYPWQLAKMRRENRDGVGDGVGAEAAALAAKRDALKPKLSEAQAALAALTPLDEEAEAEAKDPVLRAFPRAELERPDEVVLSVHGGLPQRFKISTHGPFLVEALSREIEKEIERLRSDADAQKAALRSDNERWRAILHEYLGAGKTVALDDFKTYHRAGKSFDIKINTPEEAVETLASWREMYRLEYLSRWTCLSWVCEGLLMKKGTQIRQRLLVWDALIQTFDKSFVEEVAAYVLASIKANTESK